MHKTQQSKLKIESVLRRFHHKPLDLYAYSDGHMDLLRRSKVLRTSALISSFALVLLISAILVPLYNKLEITEAATGTAKESSLSFNLTSSTASIDLSVNDTNGTFASSSDDNSKVRFNISTTNYTGYTLSIKGTNNNQTLVNGTNSSYTLSSISTATESFNSTDYNNKWGYLPSKLNSSTNTSYLPAPTATASTLDKTTTANFTANTYTIGIGARASYTTPAGEYTGTYILTVVANSIAYAITYNDESGDSTVANLPAAQSSSSFSSSSVTLSSTTPTRTGYTFVGWCSVSPTNNSTANPSCSGDTYNVGDTYYFDYTISNVSIPLYAMWDANPITCIKQYKLQNADGSYPSTYTADGAVTSYYGGNCSYSKDEDYYTTQSASSSNLTNDVTLSVELPRTTYALRINRNTTYISKVAGAGTYRWGESVAVSATASNGKKFISWSQTIGTGKGTTVNFANFTSASTAFTMPQSAATIYAEGEIESMQDFTKANCQSLASSSSYAVTDTRDNNVYTVRYIRNNCWMIQNLRFTDTSLDANTTNVAANKTLKYGDLTSGDSKTEPRIATGITTNHGIYYNYCAATAGSICTNSSSTEATQDICPAGWKLPSRTQAATIGNNNTTYVSEFSPIYSGCYSGGVHTWLGSQGFWWTTTANDSSYRYSLGYNGGKLSSGWQGGRDFGNSVRCVRSS